MTTKDIIKLLPAKREVYNEYDVENKTYNTALDDVTSALSKITIPEMATEEIEKTIYEYMNTHGYNYLNVIDRKLLAKALVGSIPKPEGKGLLQQKYVARCKELEDKLKQASNGAQFRRVEEQQKEIERLKAIIAQDYTAGRMTELEAKVSEYRVALQYIVDHKWAVDIKDGEPTFTSSRQKWINEIIDVATKALKVTKE